MGLAGSLEDMPLQDILQIIHHAKKSGKLYLSGPRGDGTIVFNEGSIVQAFAPGERVDIGKALLEGGRITLEVLKGAVAAQNRDSQGRRLGSILIDQGAVRFDDIEDVVKSQIESAVNQLIHWSEGTFNLVLEEVHLYDSIAVALDELALPRGIDTQHLLLEALRTWDERNRGPEPSVAAPAAAVEPPPVEAPAAPPAGSPDDDGPVPRRQALLSPVVLMVPDAGLSSRIFGHLRELGFPVEATGEVAEALDMLPLFCTGELRPVVLLDPLAAATGALAPAAVLGAMRHAMPQVPVIGLVREATAELASSLYRAGARNVLAKPRTDAEVEPFLTELTGLLAGILQERRLAVPAAPSPAVPRKARPGPEEAELRRLLSELRTQRETAAMTLSLLRVVSRRFERGIFFYVQGEDLVPLGAFGVTAEGHPIAGLVRELALGVPANPVFAASLGSGAPELVMLPPDAARTSPHDVIGLPASGEACLLPLVADGRPVALVYCDQGQGGGAAASLDAFGPFLPHAARAFEGAMRSETVASREADP